MPGIASWLNDGAMLIWRRAEEMSKEQMTVWSTFPASTKYFEPGKSHFMLNYIVDDLDSTLEALREFKSASSGTITETSAGL